MRIFYLVVIGCLIIALTGCESISKPYVMTTDRVDQKMDIGNRGYLKGTPPPPKDRGDLKRPFIAIDVNLTEVGEKESATAETKVVSEKREDVGVVKEAPPVKEETGKEEEVK